MIFIDDQFDENGAYDWRKWDANDWLDNWIAQDAMGLHDEQFKYDEYNDKFTLVERQKMHIDWL